MAEFVLNCKKKFPKTFFLIIYFLGVKNSISLFITNKGVSQFRLSRDNIYIFFLIKTIVTLFFNDIIEM